MNGTSASPVDRIRVASRFVERLRGLLWHDRSYLEGGMIVFPRCRSIHTFGMHEPLDVAFVDEAGLVIEVMRGIAPGRVLSNRAARFVCERFADESRWLEEDDWIDWSRAATGKEDGDEDMSVLQIGDVR